MEIVVSEPGLVDEVNGLEASPWDWEPVETENGAAKVIELAVTVAEDDASVGERAKTDLEVSKVEAIDELDSESVREITDADE